jgi:hypothetical protein
LTCLESAITIIGSASKNTWNVSQENIFVKIGNMW